MSGENCLIFNWYGSWAAPQVSFFRVQTKDDEYSKTWKNNIVAIITRDKLGIMTNLGKTRLVKVIFSNTHKVSDACAISLGRHIIIAQCMRILFSFY